MIIIFFAALTIVNALMTMFPGQGIVMLWSQIGMICSLGVLEYIKNRYNQSIRDLLSNLAILFLFVMNVYIVLGSFAHAMLSLRYPGVLSRNYSGGHAYMTQCLLVYSLALIFLYKPVRKLKSEYLITESGIFYNILMYLGLSATVLGILRIGFIPIFSRTYSDERFWGYIGPLFTRLWSYLVYPFTYFIYNYIKSLGKRKNKYLLYAMACFVPTFAFNIRYNATLSLLITLVIFIENIPRKINMRYILYAILIVVLIIQVPSFIANRRSSTSEKYEYAVTGDKLSDSLLNRLIIDSFSGNYAQTIDLITRYSDFRYGETLLKSLLVMFPNQLLYAIGIDKSEIRQDNSAFILAQMAEGTVSTGLRTGIMGEFYVNFGYYGSIFMVLWAALLNWISHIHNRLNYKDFRAILYYPIAASLIYGIVGQPDVISSMFYNTFLVGFVLFLFSKRVQVY